MWEEAFLHYVWQFRAFDQTSLQTTRGESLEIKHVGTENQHAGPDFEAARVQVGDMLWAGQVEVHRKASDWYHHGHHEDRAYDNVILHVVLDDDRPVQRPNGEPLPTLSLQEKIPSSLYEKYQYLRQHKGWIPCERHIAEVKHIIKYVFLERLVIQRLERKATRIMDRLVELKNDWEQCFYEILLENWGQTANKLPFSLLAKELPLAIVSDQSDARSVEALIFGKAGFLDGDAQDNYQAQLQSSYRKGDRSTESSKAEPPTIHAAMWKFHRLRPANFPTLRLAQLSQLLYQSHQLFAKVIAARKREDLYNLFQVVPSDYWREHYRFGMKSKAREKKVGAATVDVLIINVVAPFLFAYGRVKGDETYERRAIHWLEMVKGEQNKVIKQWKSLGMAAHSAYQTQALLELKETLCTEKKCLNCAIGNEILRND